MAGDQADLVADVGRSASPSPGKTSSTPEQSVDKQSCGDESTDWQQPSAALYADQAVSIIDQAITESDRRDDPLASARYARGWLIIVHDLRWMGISIIPALVKRASMRL